MSGARMTSGWDLRPKVQTPHRTGTRRQQSSAGVRRWVPLTAEHCPAAATAPAQTAAAAERQWGWMHSACRRRRLAEGRVQEPSALLHLWGQLWGQQWGRWWGRRLERRSEPSTPWTAPQGGTACGRGLRCEKSCGADDSSKFGCQEACFDAASQQRSAHAFLIDTWNIDLLCQ